MVIIREKHNYSIFVMDQAQEYFLRIIDTFEYSKGTQNEETPLFQMLESLIVRKHHSIFTNTCSNQTIGTHKRKIANKIIRKLNSSSDKFRAILLTNMVLDTNLSFLFMKELKNIKIPLEFTLNMSVLDENRTKITSPILKRLVFEWSMLESMM